MQHLDHLAGIRTTTKLRYMCSLRELMSKRLRLSSKLHPFDVKFHDVQGKNYGCAIPKLNKEIVPEKCKVVVKPTKVIITLTKASKGNWLDLHYKEDKLKPNLDKEKDPMAGIMDLMKNMYEEGDEEMKKTIAKAWTDARSGNIDPLKGYR
ncbi:Calcyclin-binding [Quillaja saponaria]|uniref:Calcyclin-binding n=1 Tax=Quillaja saponaria TaxID=32244 RepID=A0AAD7KWF0_QUISA|nr:Calcyclin-binding [Quillaja saponaria]KAJ7947304.1 Calcyclin-binding [Quillaja saponaria]